ncbi:MULTISPECIES: ABC transporter substrate-binding protein [Burkholderia]|uniref:Branched-chain amino acid ABC transporter substrate-binding protein n=2 Tax=Burkholderia lata (strain ATCC 17760 / DSM 23089 / LMG 22485 / NCIMB 9086 / R18194 / 383) TaxID=482957 RepID=A0A833PLQ0_BURL3|nr:MULTISPECIES: ABC transporter substrate-binding protein [Burkholderia]ABB06873.1 amino acid/amide ABC transporter substrate-binding protein, HAAT family [Burkholderia lata]KAF1033311.1 MAG: Leu/Ile/Val-binding protein [Burkholderia lata]MBN3768526.1 ABC transporter substrate-binding protein [Burkholderia sp. Se-20378]MBN3794433.1 ABC transporter substrate-binding protein [Burkholderia sp. Ac-20392]MBN3823381.1 ABC transporter substrate-binding protein [Burkholderia sp. Ac-20384]
MKMNRWMEAVLAAGLVCAAATASAQVKIGVTLSATGPAASLGIPEKNTIALLPKEIAGKSVQYIVLDDASDTSRAVQNVRKLIDEDHVDAIIGSSVTPNSLAMLDPVSQGKTPTISLAASAQIISPMDAKRAWMFKVPQNDQLMADAIAGYMAKHGVKTVGFIGFADAYGDSWYKTFDAAAAKNGLKVVSNERYNRTDASVMGQVLKLMGSNPDAVLIAGSGTPAALPAKTLKERGYKGKVYQTHGVANNDFLRVCGKDCEGEILPAGPVLVTDQLPDSNPVKKPALGYKAAYEKAYGAGSLATFGGHAWDAGLLLQRAIPEALKKGQPGTEAFREALRASIENVKDLPVSHGVINMTPTDHNGFDTRARVMVQIVDGKWKLQAE